MCFVDATHGHLMYVQSMCGSHPQQKFSVTVVELVVQSKCIRVMERYSKNLLEISAVDRQDTQLN